MLQWNIHFNILPHPHSVSKNSTHDWIKVIQDNQLPYFLGNVLHSTQTSKDFSIHIDVEAHHTLENVQNMEAGE